ncbi:MAG: hypothetical protein LW655_06190 [Limnohabitans sp.]|nr:hypothetical protein [Limnohabitans sp.]
MKGIASFFCSILVKNQRFRRIQVGGSHAWGKMYCPFNQENCRCGEFCITSIWSTPKSHENHANALMRVVEKCEVRLFNLSQLLKTIKNNLKS